MIGQYSPEKRSDWSVPEGHASQLAVECGDDLAHSLGCSGGGGDDVLIKDKCEI